MYVWFKYWSCTTIWGFYPNGRVGLRLVEDGSPVGTATVNTAIRLDPDEIIVRDYAESEGTVDALVEAGVVEPGFQPVYIGNYASRCARCRLTPVAIAEAYGLPSLADPSSALVAERTAAACDELRDRED
jgi:hypothetical protein